MPRAATTATGEGIVQDGLAPPGRDPTAMKRSPIAQKIIAFNLLAIVVLK